MTDKSITSSNVEAATYLTTEIIRSGELSTFISTFEDGVTIEGLTDFHKKLAEYFSTLPNFDVRHLTDGYPNG